MKKIVLTITIVLFITLSACSTNTDKTKDAIDCNVTPEHEECVTGEQGDNDEDDKEENENTILKEPVFDQAEYDFLIAEAKQIVEGLSLEEKAGQMVQAERGRITASEVQQYGVGSILSGGGSHPSSYDDSADVWYEMYEDYQDAALTSSSGIPLLYGIDAVHGNNNLYGATIFPHNIGLGAANNPDLVYDISVATAKEMMATGITWTFAPSLSVVQNIRWGRTYEGYSENPLIHENLTYNAILGFQDMNVSATAKHFIADGGTLNGIDQGEVSASERIIRDIHLVPYIEAIQADVDTIMISYSSLNGMKMHGNDYWINDVLKTELGFTGFIISDWEAIHQLPGSYETQVASSINAGIDMLMEPNRWKEAIRAIVNNVNSNRISIERIDDAVTRIIYIKLKQGLIDDPLARYNTDVIYNEEHKALARQAVRESLVLLKNDGNSLPLAQDSNIYITGPGADHVGYMSGGWTTYWQGNNNADIGVGVSILAAFRDVLNANGGTITSNIEDADTVVVVLTETPYTEGVGDNNNLTLTAGNAHPANAQALQTALTAQNQGKNVVGILISGRPLLLGDSLTSFDSFIAAWLPGSEGGSGISDVVFGDYNFTGRLSFTWPATFEQVGYTSNEEEYDETIVLFPFGYGLDYTK